MRHRITATVPDDGRGAGRSAVGRYTNFHDTNETASVVHIEMGELFMKKTNLVPTAGCALSVALACSPVVFNSI